MKANELQKELMEKQGALMETDVARIAGLRAAETGAKTMDALGAVKSISNCIVSFGTVGDNEVAQIYIGVLREKLLEMSQEIERLQKENKKLTRTNVCFSTGGH
ncbi:MAG: hypothetical protein NUV53_03985 [Patescibacteria group bacterium]|nr:hypothetical protein [Patescibacteria group bacterium]